MNIQPISAYNGLELPGQLDLHRAGGCFRRGCGEIQQRYQGETLGVVAVMRRRQIRVGVGYGASVVSCVRVYEHCVREHKVHEQQQCDYSRYPDDFRFHTAKVQIYFSFFAISEL